MNETTSLPSSRPTIQNQSPESDRYSEWLQHPVTQDMMLWARKEKIKLMEAWAEGNFTATFSNEMMARNAAATGACSMLEKLINLEYDDLYGE